MLRRLFQSLSDSEIYYFIFKSVTSAVPFFCFWEILQVRHVQICFQPGGKPFSLRLHWLLQKIHASLGLTVICSSSLKSDLVLFFLVLKSEHCNRLSVSPFVFQHQFLIGELFALLLLLRLIAVTLPYLYILLNIIFALFFSFFCYCLLQTLSILFVGHFCQLHFNHLRLLYK